MDTEERDRHRRTRVHAPAATIFELIADPARQPQWDGNDNLDVATTSAQVRAVGDVFGMRTTKGKSKENRIVAFEEGRTVAWLTADAGHEPRPSGVGISSRSPTAARWCGIRMTGRASPTKPAGPVTGRRHRPICAPSIDRLAAPRRAPVTGPAGAAPGEDLERPQAASTREIERKSLRREARISSTRPSLCWRSAENTRYGLTAVPC